MRANTARPVLVLIGPPGAGKSTVGRLFAERLGVPFRDTDTDIETRTGSTIRDLFVERGEHAFRAMEEQAVAAALAEHGGVLAVGGGAVTRPENRAALGGHRVVFLDTGLAEAVRRVGLGTARPLLLGNVRGQLKALLDQRRPWYQQVAWRVVTTDGKTPTQVSDEIAGLLERAETSP